MYDDLPVGKRVIITLHTARSWLLQWLRSSPVRASRLPIELRLLLEAGNLDPNGAISRAIEVHQQDTLPLPEHALAVMNRNRLAAPEQHREEMRVRLRRVQAERPRAQKRNRQTAKRKKRKRKEKKKGKGMIRLDLID